MAADSATKDENKDIENLSFEAAMSELETIVRRLEEGDVELDDAIEAYARGASLKAHCEAKLKQAQMRVDKITLDASGTASAEPASFD